MLLQMFYHYDIRGSAHDWVISHLSTRSQFVTYDGVKSNHNNVKYGLVQGSMLGLQFVSTLTFAFLFADYSKLFLIGKDANYVQRMVHDKLKMSLFGKIKYAFIKRQQTP